MLAMSETVPVIGNDVVQYNAISQNIGAIVGNNQNQEATADTVAANGESTSSQEAGAVGGVAEEKGVSIEKVNEYQAVKLLEERPTGRPGESPQGYGEPAEHATPSIRIDQEGKIGETSRSPLNRKMWCIISAVDRRGMCTFSVATSLRGTGGHVRPPKGVEPYTSVGSKVRWRSERSTGGCGIPCAG